MPAPETRIPANMTAARTYPGLEPNEGQTSPRRDGPPGTEADAVERRHDELRAELDPRSAMGKILVRQMATLSIRMERASVQEDAAVALNVRHAVEEFDKSRLDEVDRLLDTLGEAPRARLRDLKRSPEGVGRLIESWRDLRDDLTREPQPLWTAWHLERAANLGGCKVDDIAAAEIRALSRATWGDFEGVGIEVGRGDDARKATARACLVGGIDAEIAALEAHYETLDFETIELDRAGAPARALFDPSPRAKLARRYEAEATRGFYKALKELRQAEAAAAAQPDATAVPEHDETCGSLGSCRERTSPASRDPRPMAEPSRLGDDEVDFDPFSGRMGRVSAGRPAGIEAGLT